MAEKANAIIITKDETLAEKLKGVISPLADTKTLAEAKESYTQIKEERPRLLFLDIRTNTEACFGLAGRVVRFLPDTLIFILTDVKDPDLIIRSLKTGVADFMVLPVDDKHFLTSVQLALQKGSTREREGEIIVLSSNKGGQGVTTLCVNLADHIRSLTGGRVLIVDLKLQTGDVSLFLNLEIQYTVFDLLKDLPRLDENLLFSSLSQSPSGVYVLPAPEKIDHTTHVTTQNIDQMFHMLKEHMDYIIVDVAHEFTDLTAPVMDLSGRILLVSQQTVPALRSVRETLDLFKAVGYQKDKIEIIINRYEKGHEIDFKEIERLFEQDIFATVSNDYKSITESINRGDLLSANHENSPANHDMAAIAELLTGIKSSKGNQDKGGFLKKLVGRFQRAKQAVRETPDEAC